MKKQLPVISVLFIITIVAIGYNYLSPSFSDEVKSLSPPSWYHWFGTDVSGNDVFIRTMEAFVYELFNLLIVFSIIWVSGLVLGSMVSWVGWKPFREFFLNFIHYMATLPVMLISLFLLIVFGAGFINAMIILSISIIPTQALFVYNHVESAQNEDFVITKRSYGLSNISIYKFHLIPYIAREYNNYTLSRIPEIIMMNLALSFLGLGLNEPSPSLGRMLFDGLSFMFSAWWLWLFVVVAIFLLFLFFSKLNNLLFYVRRGYIE